MNETNDQQQAENRNTGQRMLGTWVSEKWGEGPKSTEGTTWDPADPEMPRV